MTAPTRVITDGIVEKGALEIARVLTDNGQPVFHPDDGSQDDVERERWLAVVEASRAALEAVADDIRARLTEADLCEPELIDAARFADNIMRAIVENDPDDLIADGGITVWHGIERDARRWINRHGTKWAEWADKRARAK